MKIENSAYNSFSIIITDDTNSGIHSSKAVIRNINSLKIIMPKLKHHLLSNEDLENFISSNFPTDVLDAYDKLTPYAYKADLAKYCILLKYGGLYADLATRLMQPLDIADNKKILCFRDAVGKGLGLWTVSTGLIFCHPNMSVFKTAIDMIINNCKESSYGPNSLHPTGPALFGRALAIVNQEEQIDVGEFKSLTGDSNPYNYGYIDSTGKIVALRMKQKGADISHLGINGSNNYDYIWRSKQVYGELVKVFNISNGMRCTTNGFIENNQVVISNSSNGIVVYGPYVPLLPGFYTGEIVFLENPTYLKITIDVVVDGAIIAVKDFVNNEDTSFIVHFELTRFCHAVEVRLLSSKDTIGTFCEMVLTKS